MLKLQKRRKKTGEATGLALCRMVWNEECVDACGGSRAERHAAREWSTFNTNPNLRSCTCRADSARPRALRGGKKEKKKPKCHKHLFDLDTPQTSFKSKGKKKNNRENREMFRRKNLRKAARLVLQEKRDGKYSQGEPLQVLGFATSTGSPRFYQWTRLTLLRV